MKMSHAFLVCLCLSGATQLAWSQVKGPTAAAIPGYLDPATGKFTTQTVPAEAAQQSGQASPSAGTGTSIFFREDFQITIQNYDQPSNATVSCQVEMSSYDANGNYTDTASVTATAVGGGWSCDVPLLTLWTLKTPTSDTISASVSITILPQGSTALNYLTSPYRSSTQSLSLAVPGNTQTIVNNVNFSI